MHVNRPYTQRLYYKFMIKFYNCKIIVVEYG